MWNSLASPSIAPDQHVLCCLTRMRTSGLVHTESSEGCMVRQINHPSVGKDGQVEHKKPIAGEQETHDSSGAECCSRQTHVRRPCMSDAQARAIPQKNIMKLHLQALNLAKFEPTVAFWLMLDCCASKGN